jgi:uncharacterized protein
MAVPKALTSRHGWESADFPDFSWDSDKYDRWDISLTGITATDDYRNELNTMGYIVEIDPYNKTVAARKRTALGRFAHEAAVFAIPVVGKPLVVYSGDDAQQRIPLQIRVHQELGCRRRQSCRSPDRGQRVPG